MLLDGSIVGRRDGTTEGDTELEGFALIDGEDVGLAENVGK